MTTLIDATTVDLDHFVLPRHLEAREPPELTLGRRDAVRMMVSIGDDEPRSSTARDLATWLHEGDLVVVNTSATIPAAVDATTPGGQPVVVHLSTELPTGLHLVEVRRTTAPTARRSPTRAITAGSRWRSPAAARCASSGGCPVRCACGSPRSICRRRCSSTCCRFGRPIRYGYVPDSWPITAYTNSFSREPGSAEMPSAGRALTAEVITDLVANGIVVAPIVLHTGVASLEAHEMPYPERYRVPVPTARLVNATHDAGGRVVAVGTTVVRALETAADRRRPSSTRRGVDGARRSRRPAACASSTACSPAGTSPRPATCRCSRPSPADRRWNLRTVRRSQQGIDGMSSATST